MMKTTLEHIVVFLLILKISRCSFNDVQPAHYWNMNNIVRNNLMYDSAINQSTRWHGRITGASEIVLSPSDIGVSLYGPNSWIDLTYHHSNCLENCSAGISITLWTNIQHSSLAVQTLLVFGSSTHGLLVTTQDDDIEVVFNSDIVNKTLMTRYKGQLFKAGVWHHVGVTWDCTDGIHLYLNGSRIEDVTRTISQLNYSMPGPDNCSMYLAKSQEGSQYTSMMIDEVSLWFIVINSSTIDRAYRYRRGLFVSNVGCQENWTPLLQNCYQHFNTAKTWSAAEKMCAGRSSDIVRVSSRKEMQFILESTQNKHFDCFYLAQNTSSTDLLGVKAKSANDTHCIYYEKKGLVADNCSRLCTFACKKERGGLFKDTRFSCDVPDKAMTGHRVSITSVPNEIECAIQCVIYGHDCQSFNYQSTGSPLHVCELNRSGDHAHIGSMEGYQFCQRI